MTSLTGAEGKHGPPPPLDSGLYNIDYAKAFHSVNQQKLCYKLQAYGISGNLLKWIQDFMSERRQSVCACEQCTLDYEATD